MEHSIFGIRTSLPFCIKPSLSQFRPEVLHTHASETPSNTFEARRSWPPCYSLDLCLINTASSTTPSVDFEPISTSVVKSCVPTPWISNRSGADITVSMTNTSGGSATSFTVQLAILYMTATRQQQLVEEGCWDDHRHVNSSIPTHTRRHTLILAGSRGSGMVQPAFDGNPFDVISLVKNFESEWSLHQKTWPFSVKIEAIRIEVRTKYKWPSQLQIRG